MVSPLRLEFFGGLMVGFLYLKIPAPSEKGNVSGLAVGW
jgi:hypothetical protein